MSSFPDYFTGWGKFQGKPYHIELDPSVSPKRTPCIPVPIHHQTAFKQQLAEMQAANILKPVNYATPWINHFVIVNKNNLTSVLDLNCKYSWTHAI